MKQEFELILQKVKQYMVLDNDADQIVDLYLATALSIELERPVWLMVVAPPSSGKTDLLNLILKLDNTHEIHGLTAKSLFSSHTSCQGGIMIRDVHEKGLLVFPDFTTVLSVNSKTRSEIFNQLRTIFDGKSSQASGIDTKSAQQWCGKVGILATVTEAIEKVKRTQNDLGERFLYYSYRPTDVDLARIMQLNKNPKLVEEVEVLVKNYIAECKSIVNAIELPEEMDAKLFGMAQFIGKGRATVERDGWDRNVTSIHQPERPFRVHILLKSMYKSLVAINGNPDRSLFIIRKIAVSSLPMLRAIAIGMTFPKEAKLDINCFHSHMNVDIPIIRRVLDDLYRQSILTYKVEDKKNIYSMKDEFRIIAGNIYQ